MGKVVRMRDTREWMADGGCSVGSAGSVLAHGVSEGIKWLRTRLS